MHLRSAGSGDEENLFKSRKTKSNYDFCQQLNMN